MRYLISIAICFLAIGCNSDPGPDAISSRGIAAFGDCAACHLGTNSIAPNPLITNGSGTAGKHVAHVSSTGISCTKCHFNYDQHPSHANGTINSQANSPSPVYFDAANASGVWSFTAPSGPGTCSNTICHKSLAPDWYGLAVPPKDSFCPNCHSAQIGLRRQVTGTGGDFATNPSVTSHHVSGASDPSSEQCVVCHEQSLHMGGIVRLHEAATGTSVTYDPASPATLEPFCLGCHNVSGASFTYVAGGTPLEPFFDGVIIGTGNYIASATIASSWSGSSEHRNKGLTCAGTGAPNTGCHGRNGSINMHGSTVKGMLTNTMNFQIPLVSQSVYTADPLGSSDYANNYKLCFDCHANYPAVAKEVVLGYRSGGVYDRLKAPTPYYTLGMQSLFRERYIENIGDYPASWMGSNQPYNDTMWSDSYLALHNYHLIGFEANAFAVDPTANMLQWKYRGDPARVGRITCTACHNVHGTVVQTIRSTHAELGLQQDYPLFPGFAPVPGESYTSIDPLIDAAIMGSYPMNCAVDCHGFKGESSYWHTPNGD